MRHPHALRTRSTSTSLISKHLSLDYKPLNQVLLGSLTLTVQKYVHTNLCSSWLIHNSFFKEKKKELLDLSSLSILNKNRSEHLSWEIVQSESIFHFFFLLLTNGHLQSGHHQFLIAAQE